MQNDTIVNLVMEVHLHRFPENVVAFLHCCHLIIYTRFARISRFSVINRDDRLECLVLPEMSGLMVQK